MGESSIPLAGAPLPMAVSPTRQARETVPGASAEMRHAADQFQAMFLSEMLGPMFEGLQTEGLGGGGIGEEVFRPMLIEKYAEAISHNGGVGIADSILRELVRMQGGADARPDVTPDAAPGARAGAGAVNETEDADGPHG